MHKTPDPDRAERNRRIVEQHRRVAAIIDRLADRLPADQLSSIRRDERAGEDALAFNLVLAVLFKRGIPVSPDEHRALVEAVGYYTQPTEYLRYVTPEVLAGLVVQ